MKAIKLKIQNKTKQIHLKTLIILVSLLII